MWLVVFGLCATIAAVGTSPRVAEAQGACGVQDIILTYVEDHVPIRQDDVEVLDASTSNEFFRGGTLSDRVAFRMWGFDSEINAGVQAHLRDTGSVQAARDELGSFTDGFLSSVQRPGENVFALETTRPGVVGTGAYLDGVVLRLVETTQGRLSVAVTTIIEEAADSPIDEEAFLFELLDEQLARVPASCRDALVEADRSGETTGAIVGIVAFTFGIPPFVSWLRDPNRRKKGRDESLYVQGFAWHDVGERVAAELKYIGAVRAGLVMGLAVATLAIFSLLEGQRYFLLAIPAGMLISSVGARWLGSRSLAAGDRRVSPTVRSGRRRPLAFLLLWLSYGFLAIGIAGFVRRIHLATYSENELVVEAALADMDVVLFRETPFYIAVIGFVLAGAMQRLARWVAQLPAAAAVRRDERAPVLLLRSFADDKIKIRIRDHRHGLIGLVHVRGRERFEELLAWTLSERGPVTIVAHPGRRRSQLGAARERIDHDKWLPVVEERIRSAGLICVVVGETAGLDAELLTIKHQNRLENTVFVVPPTKRAAERWAHAAMVLGVTANLAHDDHQTTVIAFRNSQWHAFSGSHRDGPTYVASLNAAFELDATAEQSRDQVYTF